MRTALLTGVAAAALSAAGPAWAVTAPSIQIVDAKCVEGGNCNFAVKLVGTKPTVGYKTVATAYSVNLTGKAGVDYAPVSGTVTLTYSAPAATIVVKTYQNTKIDGTRTFNVKLTKDAKARCYDCTAIGTITDDDVVPPPPPPPVVCPDGTTLPAGSTCPVTPPPPPPVTGTWVQAPLKVGGYGFVVNSAASCCNGLIVLVTRSVMSDDADPNTRHLIYYGRYVADPSGNFPGIDPANYWASAELGGWGEGPLVNGGGGLIGVAPVAVAPATGVRPTYGDTVQALSACVSMNDPDPLTVGGQYKVVGLRTTVPVGTNSTPMNLPDTVVLNPTVDDGKHRGDGYFGLMVPASCVQRVTAPQLRMAASGRPEQAPRAPKPEYPVMVATRDCRDLFNAKNKGNEDYNFVAKGESYRVAPSKTPGAVFALPMNPALGSVQASENCFK